MRIFRRRWQDALLAEKGGFGLVGHSLRIYPFRRRMQTARWKVRCYSSIIQRQKMLDPICC
jgi:hypothetical protein